MSDDDARFEEFGLPDIDLQTSAFVLGQTDHSCSSRLLSMSGPRITAQAIRTVLQRGTSCHRNTVAKRISALWPRSASFQCGNTAGGQHTSLPSRQWRTQRVNTSFSRARRRFSASAITAHGHLTPPKPGEEYEFLRALKSSTSYTSG